MQDMSSMLSRLNHMAGYDIRLVHVSPSYVKLEQRVSVDPSCTVRKIVEAKFPWDKLEAADFTIGFGVCVNNEPREMTWIRARAIMNTEIQDLWGATTLSGDEEYLIVCCLFSREEYNRQRARLDVALEGMGKWLPP